MNPSYLPSSLMDDSSSSNNNNNGMDSSSQSQGSQARNRINKSRRMTDSSSRRRKSTRNLRSSRKHSQRELEDAKGGDNITNGISKLANGRHTKELQSNDHLKMSTRTKAMEDVVKGIRASVGVDDPEQKEEKLRSTKSFGDMLQGTAQKETTKGPRSPRRKSDPDMFKNVNAEEEVTMSPPNTSRDSAKGKLLRGWSSSAATKTSTELPLAAGETEQGVVIEESLSPKKSTEGKKSAQDLAHRSSARQVISKLLGAGATEQAPTQASLTIKVNKDGAHGETLLSSSTRLSTGNKLLLDGSSPLPTGEPTGEEEQATQDQRKGGDILGGKNTKGLLRHPASRIKVDHSEILQRLSATNHGQQRSSVSKKIGPRSMSVPSLMEEDEANTKDIHGQQRSSVSKKIRKSMSVKSLMEKDDADKVPSPRARDARTSARRETNGLSQSVHEARTSTRHKKTGSLGQSGNGTRTSTRRKTNRLLSQSVHDARTSTNRKTTGLLSQSVNDARTSTRRKTTVSKVLSASSSKPDRATRSSSCTSERISAKRGESSGSRERDRRKDKTSSKRDESPPPLTTMESQETPAEEPAPKKKRNPRRCTSPTPIKPLTSDKKKARRKRTPKVTTASPGTDRKGRRETIRNKISNSTTSKSLAMRQALDDTYALDGSGNQSDTTGNEKGPLRSRNLAARDSERPSPVLGLEEPLPQNAPMEPLMLTATLEPDESTTKTVQFDDNVVKHEVEEVEREWYSKESLTLLLDHEVQLVSNNNHEEEKDWRGLEHIQKKIDKRKHIHEYVRDVRLKQVTLRTKQRCSMADGADFDLTEELRGYCHLQTKDDRKRARWLARQDAKFVQQQADEDKEKGELKKSTSGPSLAVISALNPLPATTQAVAQATTSASRRVSTVVVGATANTSKLVSAAKTTASKRVSTFTSKLVSPIMGRTNKLASESPVAA